MATLWRFRPALSDHRPVSFPRTRIVLSLLLAIVIGIPFGIAVARIRPGSTNEEGIRTTASYTFLEPSKWLGKSFPLLPYVDAGDRLARGEWTILLYHHDCNDCRRALPGFEIQARDAIAKGSPEGNRL